LISLKLTNNVLGLHLRTFEERKGIGWWKMGIWRLKGMRGNIDKSVWPGGREPHPAMRRYRGLEGQMVGKKVYKCTYRDRN
jgi:hypothetical protein